MSACAYAFFGGRFRYAALPDDKFGIHRFRLEKGTVADVGGVQEVSAALVSCLQRMGINPMVFAAASNTPDNEILWISEDDMEKYGLGFYGMDPLTTKLMERSGVTYLILDQNSDQGERRISLLCVGYKARIIGQFHVMPASDLPVVLQEKHRYLALDDEYRPIKSLLGLTAKEQLSATGKRLGVIEMVSDLNTNEFTDLANASAIGMWIGELPLGKRRGFGMLLTPEAKTAITDYMNNCLEQGKLMDQ